MPEDKAAPAFQADDARRFAEANFRALRRRAFFGTRRSMDVRPPLPRINAAKTPVNMPYDRSDPRNEIRETSKKRVDAIHAEVANLAREHGLDPKTQWQEAWQLARLKRPDLVTPSQSE
jgi:hypothetical protein